MSVSQIEAQIGIEVYQTKTPGVGGAIKSGPEDFRVEEVLVDGSKASIKNVGAKPALGATVDWQRFLLCVLVKRNWDTFIALKNVARQLSVSQSTVGFAGIKDAKAITAQHVTFEGISTDEAAKVHLKDIQLRPVGYIREPMCAFYMLGNSFGIKIKAINHPKTIIAEHLSRITSEIEESGGIPNFYGHQRFGTTRTITHLVGKALVQGHLEEAAMNMLAKPSPHEHPASRQARTELLATGDFKRALNAFPAQLRFERLMLAHLVGSPGDFAGAFRRLPLRLRMLFVQGFQSFLFNRFLSARIKSGLSSNRAEIGDFVVNVERSGLPLVRTGKIVDESNVSEINASIEKGKNRVALPIFGTRQKLSKGTMGELETRILEEEGVEAEGFKVQAIPEISGKGGLRTATCPVRDFKVNSISEQVENPQVCEADLNFPLLRGSYATVLLRELMKPDDVISAGF